MARRRTQPTFDTLWSAIRDGTAADVRALIAAAGGIPEEREEYGDPTPLMYAAALGHLDDVQALVEAGADVNEMAEPGLGNDLPELPFVAGQPMSALGYAVGYGRAPVAAFLAPLTTADLRRVAEAIAAGRQDYLDGLTDKDRAAFLSQGEPRTTATEAERQALLRRHPRLTRWVVPCVGCQRPGYRPTLPEEIDKQGTAAQVRRLFLPLSAEFVCARCQPRLDRARRDAEAKVRAQRAELPSHVKIEAAQPRPRKKRPPDS